MNVIKFGGTSMATSSQIKKACDIILADKNRKYIIVSAPGKSFDEDIKITDLLISCANKKNNGLDYDAVLETIIHKLSLITSGLSIKGSLLDDLKNELKNRLSVSFSSDAAFLDSMKAFGEYSSAKIITEYLNSIGTKCTFIDPITSGLILDGDYGNAHVSKKTYKNLEFLKDIPGLLVIPGFYGSTPSGDTITFSRGGSDITGAIIAASINAEKYENFTDVDFVFVTDPRIIKDPKPISEITYKEMRELSYAGFSVLHEETMEPLYRHNIPIEIKNTNNPSAPGTRICTTKDIDPEFPVTGIAVASGFSTINIKKYLMNREIGFGSKLLHILEKMNISYEHTPSGIDDFSIILTSDQLNSEIEEQLTKEIYSTLNVDDIFIEHNKALAMVVGEGIMDSIGLASRACGCLSQNGINLEMINQGSSRVSLMLGIKDYHREKAIKALYEEFF